jgi:two-component system, cell cycle sensor histidine kinase and response regulator CckA
MIYKWNKQKLSRSIIVNLLLATILSIGLLGSLWIQSEYAQLKTELSAMRENFLSSHKALLKTELSKALTYIEYQKAGAGPRLRQSIQERVHEANAIALNIFHQYQGKKTLAEMQQMVKDALRAIRFNQGRGYYFAFNFNGIEELFADRPEMEGKDMLPVRGAKGEYVVRDMLDVVKRGEEGFYEYSWTKPNNEGQFPKMAYVKSFAPFGWVIGTGEYLDDVESDIQKEVIGFIEQIKFGEDGYVFAGQWDGVSLCGPAKGQNMWDVTDSHGRKIVQEMIRLVKEGGGYLEYVMPRLEDKRLAPKLSYVVGIPEWKWYIGTGIYIDEIETAVEQRKREVKQQIIGHLSKITLVLAGLIAFVSLVAFHISRKARRNLEAFSVFFERAKGDLVEINPDGMDFVELQALAHTANDMVQARKRTEASLMLSETRLRATIENTPNVAVQWYDAAGRIQYWNHASELMYGWRAEEVLGKTLDACIQTLEEAQEFRRILEGIQKTGHPCGPYETSVRRRDGSEGWVLATVFGLPMGNGEIRFVCMDVDITERKRAEEALRESEKKYRDLFERSPVGIFQTSSKGGHALFLNPEMGRILGANSSEEALENFQDIARDFYVDPNRREAFIALLKDRGVAENFECEVKGLNGKRIWLNANARAREMSADGTFLIDGFCSDITERKRAEEERDALQAQLLQAQKMESVGQLAGGVAHDFNNMLSVIMGYTELGLIQCSPSDPLYRNLKAIRKAAQRSVDLTQQLLAFARKQTVAPKVLNLNDTVSGMLKMLRRLIGEDIDMIWVPQEGLRPVKMDPSQIDQILANLCVNARDAIAGVGKITIETHNTAFDEAYCAVHLGFVSGEYVMLSFSDDGCGMRKEILDHIFEPFFTTKEVGKGTGLGLATVYGIVKQNEGFTNVTSEPGKGTIFRIYLPCFEKEAAVVPTESTTEIPQGRGETILLVEDEPMIMEVSRAMLEKLGYKVLSAGTPSEALRQATVHAAEIQLLITDVVMPEMNGRELAELICGIKPGLKCLFTSGYTTNVIAHHGVLDDGVSFLKKPFSMKDLATVIGHVLPQE